MTDAQSFVLPVDKPEGPTSHDVVAIARRALGVRRIGHTGTLDPFASGLMLLCVGHATRIAEYVSDLPKRYRATARLDGRTLTDDNTAELLEASERWRELSDEEVAAALQTQTGPLMQMPPQFSAKKIAGERAYDIARRGDVATLTAVPVTIYDITLVRCALPEIVFDVECSSGTYIRAIARDVGAQLGTGGYLSALRRTAIGSHDVDAAVTLEQLGDAARVQAAAITPLATLAHLPLVELDEAGERAIRFGQAVASDLQTDQPVRLSRDSRLIGIGAADGAHLRPRKVLPDA